MNDHADGTDETPGASRILVRRDYFSTNSARDTRPYVGVMHDERDVCVNIHNLFNGRWEDGRHLPGLLDAAGIEDGDEFVIEVRRTGARPFGDRRVILGQPNEYGVETDAQLAFRARHGRIWNYKDDAPVDDGKTTGRS